MSDAHHAWGGDLSVSPTGDLQTATGPALGTERVLRRLLTNPGDDLWQPGYGAGLARFVGPPADAAAIRALIRPRRRPSASKHWGSPPCSFRCRTSPP